MKNPSYFIPQHQETTWVLYRRLWRDHIRHYRHWMVGALILMALVAGSTAAIAKLIQPILDKVFIERDPTALWTIGSLVLLTFMIRGFATFGQNMVMSAFGNRIVTDIQKRLFAHVIYLDLGFFYNNSTGVLLSRFSNDITMLRSVVSNTLTGFGKDSMTLIFLVALMFHQDPFLAFITLFVFPIGAYPIIVLGKKLRKLVDKTQGVMERTTTVLEQVFSGIRHVKAYGMEEEENTRLRRILDEFYRLTQRAQRNRSILYPIVETLGGLTVVTVIVYGGLQVIEGTRTTGAFFSFVTAFLLSYEPFKNIARLNSSIQEGMAAAQRLYNFLAVKPSITNKPNAIAVPPGQPVIELKNVAFSYEEKRPALRGVSLKVPPGKTAALVGLSGSGKTTILNLIPRFFDVDQGAVLINNADVRDVTLESLRASIALVSQEIILFDDTVRVNIGYGKPGASEEEIIAAATTAGAHEFIKALPQGYDTLVGTQGLQLSGGQRQRVAIARAMLKNAPVLLLDEATSALDTQSERYVQAALKVLMKGRTTIVVAHRLSTILDADIIYVMDQGLMIESGTHQELLAKDGAYAQLHRLQFAAEKNDDEDYSLTTLAANAAI